MAESEFRDHYSKPQRLARLFATLSIVGGILLVAVGGASLGAARVQLANQHVSVSDDAPPLAGTTVTDPFSALAQAESINFHVGELAGGKPTHSSIEKIPSGQHSTMQRRFAPLLSHL